MPILHSEDEESSDGDYSSESESEEEEVSLKPVFVRKENRMTIKEQESKQMEEERFAAKKKIQEEERKNQTRTMVAESIRRTEQMNETHYDDADSDAGLPDDADDVDDELEVCICLMFIIDLMTFAYIGSSLNIPFLSQYEAWKVREMARLTRDAEEREEAVIEKAELLRRRNMTDEERLEEDRLSGRLDDQKAEKPKRNFMQKYYHKGVFYMDSTSLKNEDDVRNKDYAAEPTQWDKINVEALPAVLQVKNFGKRGRTKYTHLLDQDTTVRDKKRMDVRPDERVMNKYLDKRSGVGKL